MRKEADQAVTIVQPWDEAGLEDKAMVLSEESPEYMRREIWKQKGKDLAINKIRKYESRKEWKIVNFFPVAARWTIALITYIKPTLKDDVTGVGGKNELLCKNQVLWPYETTSKSFRNMDLNGWADDTSIKSKIYEKDKDHKRQYLKLEEE